MCTDLKMAASNMASNGTQSYARAAGTKDTETNGKPIFFKHRDVPNVRDKDLETQEVYKSLLKNVPSSQIMGIQRIGGLWRLYIIRQETRINLITSGVHIRDTCVAVYDTNPFRPGESENLLRLTIKDIPLSVNNSVILDELEKRKYKVSGKVTLQKLRVDGLLTNCLTGDRVIFIERPTQPLPRLMSFGIFRGKVFHANQIAKDQTNVTCSNCLIKGHHRSSCKSKVVCRFCQKEGHYQRDCPIPDIEHETDIEKLSETPKDAADPTQHGGNPRAEPRRDVLIATRSTADERDALASQSQRDCPIPDTEKLSEEPKDAAAPTQNGGNPRAEPRRDVPIATSRTADGREVLASQSRTPDDKGTRAIAPVKAQQSKITQFIQQEREALSSGNVRAMSISGDQSDDESEEFATDDCQESDISVESPDMPKAGCKTRAQNQKRKQKKEKKPKKK